MLALPSLEGSCTHATRCALQHALTQQSGVDDLARFGAEIHEVPVDPKY